MAKISKAGLELIKKSEGCRLAAYKDPIGIVTIGYGHVSSSVKLGQVITQHQADEILASDLERFEAGVDRLCPGLSPGQFSALVSFAFNLGLTAFANSTLRKKVLKNDFAGAALEFGKWVKAGGKVLPGLVTRRAAERALFEAT